MVPQLEAEMEAMKHSLVLQHNFNQAKVEGLHITHKREVEQLHSGHLAELELKDAQLERKDAFCEA